MHKNSENAALVVMEIYSGSQRDIIIVVRLSVGLKFGNFSFWSFKAEIM